MIIKPASLQALRAKQPVAAHIHGIEQFDIICHHHTNEWINKGALNIPVVHWSGFGSGRAGHPKNDYTLLFGDGETAHFGEKMKRVKIGKPVSLEFSENVKEPFIFQCSRHDGLMGSEEVARQCIEAGIKGYFAGPIISGSNLMSLIDNKTTFYLGILSEEDKMEWTRRATLTTYLHDWDTAFNLSVIESWSVGTPILANLRGFFRKVLKNGVNGFAFNGQNFKASFHAAKKLHQKHCWESAREYGVEEMLKSFTQAFDEILKERSSISIFTKGDYTYAGTSISTLGDTLWFTPLALHQKNLVVQMPKEKKAEMTSRVFDGLCPVEFVDNPIPTKKSGSKTHMANQILEAYGFFGKNYVPKIAFTKAEIDRAKDFAAQFKKPIVFCNQNSGCHDPMNASAHYIRPSPNLINILSLCLQELGHTILQFEPKPDLFGKPFPIARLYGAIQIQGLDVRDLGAVYKIIGRYVGGDTGDHHLMIASGGKCLTLVPPNSAERGYLYTDVLYRRDSFAGEENRDFCLCHQDWIKNIDSIVKTAKMIAL